jgi:thioredoxin 1
MAATVTLELNEQNFDALAGESDRPVLVDFWAEWCMPCRVVGPTVDELARAYEGRVTVAKLNVDESPGVAAKLGISAIPTLMIFRDGEPIRTLVGVQTRDQIAAALDQSLQVAA